MCVAAQIHSAQLQAGPTLTRDNNPFSMVYGQPMPVAATLPDPGRSAYALTLDITNTLNSNIADDESLLLDYESYILTTSFSYSPAENWALKIDIPLIYRSGGFLDPAIERWHTLFGLPQSSRTEVANDQFNITHTRNGITDVDINTTTQGIGDIQLSLGRQLIASADTAASLWVAADLPSGDRNTLTGNGAVDYSAWIAAASRLNAKWIIDTNAGVLLPGDSVIDSLQTRKAVAFGHAGVRWSIHPVIDLKLQLAAHSAYYQDTSMKMLGRSYILVFGGTAHLGHCSALDIGVSEDIKAGTAPDVSFLASWVSTFGNCAKGTRQALTR